MIKDEIDNYRNDAVKFSGVGVQPVLDELDEFQNQIDDNKTIPVCILSHMYDKKRSKFLVNLVNEDIDRDYIIFTYEDQKILYSQFETINDNLTVHYIPCLEQYLTLSGKRQYILDWSNENNHENAFFIEDDCYNYYLPIGGIGNTGNFRNRKFSMTFAFTFSFWEFLIKKHKLTYSGPVNNMEFTFRNLDENPFIKQNAQVVQTIHINTKLCKEKSINFDHNAGWDDYDMIINQCVNNQGTQGIIFSYVTPALKSGVSAMSSSADALAKRCERNSKALIKKWGLGLVREDTKKDLYNAKVNWSNIRKCYQNSLTKLLPQIIGLTNDDAKQLIRETLNPELKEKRINKKSNISETHYTLWE